MQFLINQLQLAVQNIDPTFKANLFVLDDNQNLAFQNDHTRSNSLLSAVESNTTMDHHLSATTEKRETIHSKPYFQN
tara:strand:+ start:114 stop:344 length:231 start_codon:yes stop_codon:yes gene_type:complete